MLIGKERRTTESWGAGAETTRVFVCVTCWGARKKKGGDLVYTISRKKHTCIHHHSQPIPIHFHALGGAFRRAGSATKARDTTAEKKRDKLS